MFDLFFRNRRLLVLSICLIFVGGLSSFLVLPRMEDPTLTPRAANISTLLPGRDAETVESLVTEPIEDQIYEIEEIKEVRSVSRQGASLIAVELRDDVYESEKVWSRIRDKVNDVIPELPDGATDPEFIDLDFKAFAMIVALTWESSSPPNYAILRRQAEEIKEKLKLVSGTEKVKLFGDPQEEVLVELDYDQIISLGLTVSDVSRQISASDAKVSAGLIRAENNNLLMELGTQLDTLDEISRIPIRTAMEGQIVQLRDIANIRKHIVDPPSSLAIVEGKRSIAIGVFNRDTGRIDLWSKNINQRLEEIRAQLPAGIELKTVYEQNQYVQARLSSLIGNLILGSFAIAAVIFVMMGWRNALIVVSALPFAASMVLAGMRILEIPIHQMSVTGLIIALGLLIDNAIVMVDEVTFKMRTGYSAGGAIKSCVKHLFVPLLGSTLTTALAFGPIALMPGPAGEFVGSIAISVIMAIMASFFLAMTVIPTLTGIFSPFGTEPKRLLDPNGSVDSNDELENSKWWLSGVTFPKLKELYSRSLGLTLRKPIIGLAVGAAIPVFGFIQSRNLPEQFFPPADRNQIQIELELPALSSIGHTLEVTAQIREELLKNERVNSVDWFLGESAPTFYYNVIPRRENSSQYAQACVGLDSPENLPSLIHELQRMVDEKFPSSRTLVRQLEQGPPFDAPVEVRLFGPDLGVLRQLGDEVRTVLVNTPGVVHTRCDLNESAPTLTINLDEEQARLANLNPSDIAEQLNAALEGSVGGSIIETTEELPLRVRLKDSDRSTLDRVMSMTFLPNNRQTVGPSSDFQGIPLSSIATTELKPETASITHLAGRRMNEIQAFIPAGVLPAEVLEPLKKRIEESDIYIPRGYSLTYGGESAKRDEAVGNLMSNVSVLMVLMVATLVLSFGSFRLASVVGIVAVLSVGLGMGALWIFGYPFGFMAIVGTMGLIGVAINDTIVVLAAIREDELAKSGDVEAVRAVVIRSTRHIVSTSLTTMAGFLPLILSGGGFWPPLAVTIAGGVSGATIIALYFAPSAYVIVMCDRWKRLFRSEERDDAIATSVS